MHPWAIRLHNLFHFYGAFYSGWLGHQTTLGEIINFTLSFWPNLFLRRSDTARPTSISKEETRRWNNLFLLLTMTSIIYSVRLVAYRHTAKTTATCTCRCWKCSNNALLKLKCRIFRRRPISRPTRPVEEWWNYLFHRNALLFFAFKVDGG